MKIVRIIARLNIGGPSRNAVLLAEGFPGTILVCGEVDKAEGDMKYLALQKGIQPVFIKELAREISWRDDLAAFWKIYRIICRERPDIIHSHTAKAGTLGRLAGILYGKAVLVHTFHGHVFRGYFGRLKTLFFIWIERILALFTDRIITVSENLKKELVENFKIAPAGKISVIELGFELDELFALPLKENKSIINIGIIGRLVPIKNHKMFFRAVKSILRQAPNTKLKAIIVGDGEMRAELERYAGELGLVDIVEFRGWMRDLKSIYEDLDIVVLTSANEGTPVSIIEAMAAARPVVATRVGGVSDIVEDGKSGYLAGPNEEEYFAQKLLDLIRDPEKIMGFGEYGRGLVKEKFTKERLINNMEKLYNSFSGNRRYF